MGSVRRGRATAALAALGLAAGLALAGCGGSESSNDSAVGMSGAAPARDTAEGGADTGAVPPAAKAAEPEAPQPGTGGGVEQRQIIYTGSITVRVESVERTAAEITSLVTGAGGFVGGDKRHDNGNRSEAVLTLRVPAARFTQVVDAIAEKGTDDRREISTEDVTEESIDLDARIATQRARVDSARRLLAQAKNLSDLISLENELGRREADLASLEAKKRRLDDLTALSTITATLLGPDAQPAPEEDDGTGFLAGLKGGWKAFAASLRVALTVLGALVPWLVVAGVALAAFYAARRFRRRPAVAVAGAPAPPVPAQKEPADVDG